MIEKLMGYKITLIDTRLTQLQKLTKRADCIGDIFLMKNEIKHLMKLRDKYLNILDTSKSIRMEQGI